jgi:putative membrane protein
MRQKRLFSKEKIMNQFLKPLSALFMSMITGMFLTTGGVTTAYGQQSGNAHTQKSSGSSTDRDFTDAVLKSWMLEVALAKDATTKASDPDVKTFANHVIQNDSEVGQSLTRIATQEGLKVPGEMGGERGKILDEISKLKGPKFDRAYINFAITDHRGDIKEFTLEARAGRDPSMKAFASKTALQFHERLSEAESIGQKLASQHTKYPWWEFWKKV